MRTVADVMNKPVVVERSTTLQEASAQMLDRHTEAAVVVEQGKVAGVLSAQDVVRALAEGRDSASTTVGAVCDPSPSLVQPDAPLVEVHEQLLADARELAVAIGPHREPVGIIGA